jgi:isoleucyl-tRNA synthetase
LALCCNSKLGYVEIEETKTGIIYICLEARLEFVFEKNYHTAYKILRKFKGLELKGLEYEPLFDCCKRSGADTRTGVVHQSPHLGEDDHRVCLHNGMISKDGEKTCSIDSKGRFV